MTPITAGDLTVQEQMAANQANQVLENGIVVSNVNELVASVITRIASTDTSESLGGPANKGVVVNLVQQRIKENLL